MHIHTNQAFLPFNFLLFRGHCVIKSLAGRPGAHSWDDGSFLYSCAVATQEWCMATFCKHGHSSQRGQASMTQLRYSILPYDAIAVEWIHPEIPLSSLSGNIAPCVGLCY